MTLVLALSALVALFLIVACGVGPINPGGRSGVPGITLPVLQQQNVFLKDHDHKMQRRVIIEASSLDTGNTVAPGATTKLRAGLALVRVETGANKNKYVPIGHADDPGIGSRVQGGILAEEINMLTRDLSTTADAQGFAVIHGWVDASKIFYNGAGGGDITDFQELMSEIIFESAA